MDRVKLRQPPWACCSPWVTYTQRGMASVRWLLQSWVTNITLHHLTEIRGRNNGGVVQVQRSKLRIPQGCNPVRRKRCVVGVGSQHHHPKKAARIAIKVAPPADDQTFERTTIVAVCLIDICVSFCHACMHRSQKAPAWCARHGKHHACAAAKPMRTHPLGKTGCQ
jgi:hypothetical protein